MFDQSFSSKHIEVIFNIENRKGHIDFNTMPQAYKDVVTDIRACRNELLLLHKKKQKEWSDDENTRYIQYKDQLSQRLKEKDEVLQQAFNEIEGALNSRTFSFQILKTKCKGKPCFTIDRKDWPQFYAMKILQRNLNHLFNIEPMNCHTVMTNIKLLLNTNIPVYLIRTDVCNFFESIPQDQLLHLIERNSLLSTKTKSMVKKVLMKFEEVKDTSSIAPGKGVPRGIGISSPLSEIYMGVIDREISERPEILYYARYVDDIFIILSSLGDKDNLQNYYASLQSYFESKGLTLQSEGSDKCKLVDKFFKTGGSTKPEELSYLGYRIMISKPSKEREAIFGLSDHRKKVIKTRIDHLFTRFANIIKVNPAQARRDLYDGLKLIIGNYRLSKAKSGVKVGFYYNNDLLDRKEDFEELQTYLQGKVLDIPDNLFANPADRQKYEDRLKKYIKKVNFAACWKSRKMYRLSDERIKMIKVWL